MPQATRRTGDRTLQARVWDLPLRVFHWLLVLAVAAAIATGKLGGPWLDWHARSGALVMGLLIFRLAWGFIGSRNARFASFFPTPTRLRDYFEGRWQGLGHNPLGALSVLALLAILSAQVATGLLADDGSDFRGPLSALVSQAASQRSTYWHELSFNLLAVLMGLHVGAIAFHAWARKTNLLLPMLTGNKPLAGTPSISSEPARAWQAVLAALLSYALVAGTFNLPATPGADASSPQAPVADW
jgi:cytochrome b